MAKLRIVQKETQHGIASRQLVAIVIHNLADPGTFNVERIDIESKSVKLHAQQLLIKLLTFASLLKVLIH